MTCTASKEGIEVFQQIFRQVQEGVGKDLKTIQNTFPVSSGFRGKSRVAWELESPSLLSSGNIDDCVVKFPLDRTGQVENPTEIQEWQKFDPEVKQHLADLHDWSDPEWIIQQKADTDIGFDAVNEIVKKLRNAGYICEDVTKSDIGRVNGELVLIDWGEGCRKMDNNINKSIEEFLEGSEVSIELKTHFDSFLELGGGLKSTTFSIITAEAPANQVDVDGNPQQQLRKDLQALELDVKQISGQFGGVQENPFLAGGAGGLKQALIELGEKYGHPSIIWGEDGIFQLINTSDSPGQVIDQTSEIVNAAGAEDNFSIIDGIKFRFPFNF